MIITNRADLIKQIEKISDGAQPKSIKFFCNEFKMDFLSVFQNTKLMTLGQEITHYLFNASAKKQADTQTEVAIYSTSDISIESLLTRVNNTESKEKHIVRHNLKELQLYGYTEYSKENSNSGISKEGIVALHIPNANNAFIDFLGQLKGLSSNTSAKTLTEVIDGIDEECIEGLSNNAGKLNGLLNNLRDNLKNQAKHISESDIFDEALKESAMEGLDKAFDDIKKYIVQAKNQEWKEYIKIAVEFMFNVVSFGKHPLAMLVGGAYGFANAFLSYNDFKSSQYDYVFKNPIIKFLSIKAGIYANMVNAQLLNQVIIAEYETGYKIIDLSGFNLLMPRSDFMLAQELGFMFEGDYSQIAQYLQSFIYGEKYSDILDLKLPNCNICSTQKTKQNLTPAIKLLEDKAAKLNHFAYIETPFFNSAKFAQILIAKNQAHKELQGATTQMSKNYLVISNCPLRHNAKLTEEIIQHIATIDRGDSTPKPKFSPKAKTYTSQRDFSQYHISIANNDKPYILSLSPFTFISEGEYKELEEENKEFENYRFMKKTENAIKEMLQMGATEEGLKRFSSYLEYLLHPVSNLVGSSNIKSLNSHEAYNKAQDYQYIKYSFKQDEQEREKIIERETKSAEIYLGALESFIKEAIVEPKRERKQYTYGYMDILFIIFGLYIFKKNFAVIDKLEFEGKSAGSGVYYSYIASYVLKFNNKSYKILDTGFSLIISDLGGKINAEEILKIIQDTLEQIDSPEEEEQASQKSPSKDFFASFLDDIKEQMRHDLGLAQPTTQNQSDNEDKQNDEGKQSENYKPSEEDKAYLELDSILIQSPKYKEGYQQYVDNLQQKNAEDFLSNILTKTLASLFPPFELFVDDFWQGAMKRMLGIFIDHFAKRESFSTMFKKELGIIYIAKLALSGKLHNLVERIKSNKNYSKLIKEYSIIECSNAKVIALEQHGTEILEQLDTKTTHKNIQVIKQKALKSITSKDFIFLQNFKKTILMREIDNNKIIFFNLTELMTLRIDGRGFSIASRQFIQSYIFSKKLKIKDFSNLKEFENFSKNIKLNFATTLGELSILALLDFILPNVIEAQKQEYENLMHTKFSYFYDAPLALRRDGKVYYPMLVNDNFSTYDLKSLVYGSRLCTGGLSHHCALLYHVNQEKSDNSIHTLTLQRLLKFLIIDAKRGAASKEQVELDEKKQTQDKKFFKEDISLDNISRFMLEVGSELCAEYREIEKRGGISNKKESPIYAYNRILEILNDYKDYYLANSTTRDSQNNIIGIIEDKNKARELMLCLTRIGRNNIKALYVGTSPISTGKPRPKLIGRLATTIIIENGLWLG